MNYLPLSILPRKKLATIEHMRLTGHLRASLMALGIIEGLQVRMLHEGPFGGDPIAVEIGGHIVSLRKSDAKNILVSVLDTAL
jgi:ferrous iron transport protein A